MRRYKFTYFLGQCFKGLWRNGIMTAASITVLMSCLVVVGSFSLLILNINENLENLALLNEIVVFIDETKTDEEVEAIGEKIRSFENVSDVRLITKEEALEEEKEKYAQYSGLYELVEGDNPLRDSFVIRYKDNSMVSTLDYQLRNMSDEGVVKVNNRLDLATKIEDIKSGISLVLVWFMAILLVVSVFVIINTIKLAVHARRAEIAIMRYIGATQWFVMLPFVMEGIVIGLISAVLAFFLEWYMYGYVVSMIGVSFNFLTILDFVEIWPMLACAFLGIGVMTGIIGSTISTRKHLKA